MGAKFVLTEIMYIVIGLIMWSITVKILKDKEHPKRVTSALFWGLLGVTFIFPNIGVLWGSESAKLPPVAVGYIVLILAVLAAFNRIDMGKVKEASKEEKQASADRLKNWIFIPAVSIALFMLLFATLPATKKLGSLVALGLASLAALIVALITTKGRFTDSVQEGGRLLKMVGALAILPQLLAALGAVFATAGVGNVIADMVGGVIPEGNHFLGVFFYCLGMAVFTIIMGNGFAAFAVITAGIGLPFVIAQGGNPVIVGALGLTAGYCGTLLTPMAANFNVVPGTILEMKNKQFGVIKRQAPVAVVMWVLHVIAMYVLAF